MVTLANHPVSCISMSSHIAGTSIGFNAKVCTGGAQRCRCWVIEQNLVLFYSDVGYFLHCTFDRFPFFGFMWVSLRLALGTI